MRHIMLILILIFGIVTVDNVQAEKYKGDGSWVVYEYGEGIVFVSALDIFRENPDKGATPTFMVNYNDKDGCYVSLGLIIFAKDIPEQSNKKEMLSMLKSLLEQADFLADDEVLASKDDSVQALDMGGVLYARKIIDSDALAAFMLAKNGMIRIRNRDAVIEFSMFGFNKTINQIIDSHCK